MNEIANTISPEIIFADPKRVPKKLNLIEDLLNEFHSEQINYCHWKSNEHLDASMTADTDLDVLFDEGQKESIELLLGRIGFKRFNSIRQKQYKDIEDFIGLDLPSGKVVHLHAHFRLTLGEAFLKGYQVDLEEKVLNSRVFDETFGIYTISPAFEMVLLYIRESLKIRKRDVAVMFLKNKKQYTGNILSEYKWLRQKVTNSELEFVLKSIFENYKPIFQIMSGSFNRIEVLKLSGLIKKEFTKYRLFSPFNAVLLRWYRELSVKIYKKSAIFFNRPIVSKRINPRGGLVIAVVGADGSGKSTVTTNLQSTFKVKLDVYRIYFGRGDGRISWSRKLLLSIKSVLVPSKAIKRINKVEGPAGKKPKGFLANIYKCLEALIVANEKRKNLKLMKAARMRGMLVICDRFPQNQVMGYNDGPLLSYLSSSSNPFFRMVSKLEAVVYKKAENNPPDIMFKLIADAKIVEARKPNETSLEMLEAKIAGIKGLNFANGCNVVTIDATQPLEKVLFTIKKKIWNSIP